MKWGASELHDTLSQSQNRLGALRAHPSMQNTNNFQRGVFSIESAPDGLGRNSV